MTSTPRADQSDGHSPSSIDLRMSALSDEYTALEKEYGDIVTEQDALPSGSHGALMLDGRAEAVSGRQKELLDEMTASRPETHAGLRAKAAMLRQFIARTPDGSKNSDPEDRLQWSLIDDILQMRNVGGG
jgi:hypothetical protein